MRLVGMFEGIVIAVDFNDGVRRVGHYQKIVP